MAWGGTISQVAQNELTLSAQQRAAHERELELLLRAHEQQNQNALQTRALDQRDRDSAEHGRQFDATMLANSGREDRLGKYNEESLNLRRDELRDRGDERKSNEEWRRKTFTLNDEDRKLRELMPYAEQMANDGMFGNTEEVIQHFPSLAGQAPAIAARSKAARMAIEGQRNADQSDADLLNEGPGRASRLQNMITAEKDHSWNGDNNHWWRSNQPDTSAVDEWQSSLNQVNAARATVAGDRGRMGRLVPDASGRYSPGMTLPWQANATPTVSIQSPTQFQAPPSTMSRTNAVPNADAVLQEAQRAIQAGKDPQAVRQRLIQMGITPNF